MKAQTVYVGIDVSKAHLDVAIQLEQGKQLGRFKNNQKGFDQLQKAVLKAQSTDHVIHLVLEPTGGYELRLVAWARQLAWRISLPNPVRVRQWANSEGRRAKTDPQDALMLAAFGAAKQLDHQKPMAPEVVELDQLLSLRDDLNKQRQAESNRLQQWLQRPDPSSTVVDSIQRRIAHLDEELALFHDAIDDLFKQHKSLRTQRKRLLSVPGIGPKNVLYLLVLFNRFYTLTHGEGSAKSITAFVGIDPVTHRSGSSIRKRSSISKMGSSLLRAQLFMGAFGGVRGNNPLRHFYQRLVGRGKPKRLALVASARKLLVWGWHVFKHETLFDSSRHPIPQSVAISA